MKKKLIFITGQFDELTYLIHNHHLKEISLHMFILTFSIRL